MLAGLAFCGSSDQRVRWVFASCLRIRPMSFSASLTHMGGGGIRAAASLSICSHAFQVPIGVDFLTRSNHSAYSILLRFPSCFGISDTVVYVNELPLQLSMHFMGCFGWSLSVSDS